MKKQLQNKIAMLCIAVCLVCVFAAFAFSAHDCTDADCLVCAFLENSRIALLALAFVCAAVSAVILPISFFAERFCAFSVRECTPVGRKVKLLD